MISPKDVNISFRNKIEAFLFIKRKISKYKNNLIEGICELVYDGFNFEILDNSISFIYLINNDKIKQTKISIKTINEVQKNILKIKLSLINDVRSTLTNKMRWFESNHYEQIYPNSKYKLMLNNDGYINDKDVHFKKLLKSFYDKFSDFKKKEIKNTLLKIKILKIENKIKTNKDEHDWESELSHLWS